MRFASFVVVSSLFFAGCGGSSSPTTPTPAAAAAAPTPAPSPAPTPTPTPTPTPSPAPAPTFSVAGVLSELLTNKAIAGATITITDGTYAGRSSATDGNGYYSIAGVSGTFFLRATRLGYDTIAREVTVGRDTRFDFAMASPPVATPAPTPTPSPSPSPAPSPSGTRIGAICRDGTSSDATGSGACSSHGGVSCWRYSDGSCRAS